MPDSPNDQRLEDAFRAAMVAIESGANEAECRRLSLELWEATFGSVPR